MNKQSVSMIEGVFFTIRVSIKDKKLVRIYNKDKTLFDLFKPTCDKIARYLIDEGFVTTTKPRIEIVEL